MAYTGARIPLPIASGGLYTDTSPDQIPAANLIRAENIQITNGILEKAYGSLRWNAEALPSGIVAVKDYWPNPGTQYTIVVTREGRIYRFKNKFSYVEITPTTDESQVDMSGTPPETLSVTERVQIIICGKEFVGAGGTTQPSKVMVLTGNSPIQVFYGEETVRHNLLVPAPDWDGSDGKKNYPTFGIVYLNRVFLMGNKNLPFYGYASSDTYGGAPFQYGHEDFSATTFNTALFNVFPGDGERNQCLFQYKTKLWMLKYPRGLYSLNVPDVGVPTGWYFEKVNDDVGTASISGACAVQDDVWVINSVGTVQSLTATLNLGGVSTTNVLKQMKIEKYINSQTNPLGFGDRQAFWHQADSTAYFLYRGANSRLNSFLLSMDFSQETPIASVVMKDQPNVLEIRRDVNQVEELIYGSEDGYIYIMNQSDRYVGPQNSLVTGDQVPYQGVFQTPHSYIVNSNDMTYNLGAQSDKIFDFLEIEYIPTGESVLFADVYIDGSRRQTVGFTLNRGNELDHFILDQSRLQGDSTIRQKKSIAGRGRTISFKFYDDGQSFTNFKITGLTVYARKGGEDNKGSQDAGTKGE